LDIVGVLEGGGKVADAPDVMQDAIALADRDETFRYVGAQIVPQPVQRPSDLSRVGIVNANLRGMRREDPDPAAADHAGSDQGHNAGCICSHVRASLT
jgi:hypothetical protein